MSVQTNKAIIRRYYEELWNGWDLALADEIISPEIQFRGSLGVAIQGRDGFKEYVQMVRAAFPDFHNTVEELIGEGDRIVARLSYRGTHLGPLSGVAPTGRHVTYAGVALFRLLDGRITDGWVLGDRFSLMEQLAR